MNGQEAPPIPEEIPLAEDVVAMKNQQIASLQAELRMVRAQLKAANKPQPDLSDVVKTRIIELENARVDDRVKTEKLEQVCRSIEDGLSHSFFPIHQEIKALRLQMRAKDAEIDKFQRQLEAAGLALWSRPPFPDC